MAARYPSFGLATPAATRAIAPDEAVALLRSGEARTSSLLAYGNGRSYGDTCQNGAGTLVDMRSLNRLIQFNPDTGLFRAEVRPDERIAVIEFEHLLVGLACGGPVLLREGCDRTLDTCAMRFGNAVNFQGEPFLPGNDMITRYPIPAA